MSEHRGRGNPDDAREERRDQHDREPHVAGFTDATRGEREIGESEVLAHEEALPHAGRHDFEPDVERIHRPLFREPRDPLEGREPAPWWLWAIAAAALFWGGWYLGRRGGNFGLETHTAYREIQEEIRAEAVAERTRAAADPVATGRTIYAARCQACHQQNGRGAPGVFPPVVGSEWVTGPLELPVLVVLHGLQGPITVAGVAYNGAMPAWNALLSDEDVAAVLTYIRQLDANNASPVSPEQVKRLRAATASRQAPWTEPELKSALQSAEVRSAVQDQPSPSAAGTPR